VKFGTEKRTVHLLRMCWAVTLTFLIGPCYLPETTADGHPNYLKSARLYLQKMYALKDDNPEVHQKFQSGFHVIRRSSQYWAFLGSDLVIDQTLMRSLKSHAADARKWDVRAPENSLGHVFHWPETMSPAYNLATQELTARS